MTRAIPSPVTPIRPFAHRPQVPTCPLLRYSCRSAPICSRRTRSTTTTASHLNHSTSSSWTSDLGSTLRAIMNEVLIATTWLVALLSNKYDNSPLQFRQVGSSSHAPFAAQNPDRPRLCCRPRRTEASIFLLWSILGFSWNRRRMRLGIDAQALGFEISSRSRRRGRSCWWQLFPPSKKTTAPRTTRRLTGDAKAFGGTIAAFGLALRRSSYCGRRPIRGDYFPFSNMR